MPRKLKNRSFHSQLHVHMKTAYIHVHVCICAQLHMYSVTPKGWYHGTPPPINFKVYVEMQCFTTQLNIAVQTSCTPPPFSLPGEKTVHVHVYMYILQVHYMTLHVVYIIYITNIFTHCVYYMYNVHVYVVLQHVHVCTCTCILVLI